MIIKRNMIGRDLARHGGCLATDKGTTEKSIFVNIVNTHLAISDSSISPSSFLSKDSS